MNITVQPGQTLWAYSQAYNVPLNLIIDSNPNINPNALNVGQTVKIPGFVMSNYQIKANDTLWNIAQYNGIPLYALLFVNPGLNPNNLRVGERINVPLRVTWLIINPKRKYDYNAFLQDLNNLLYVYPFLRRRSIGNSVMGKSIPEIKIGTGQKNLHIDGSFHANEWITTPVIMQFLNEYARAITNQTPIRGLSLNPYYNQTTLSIVPMVNPDGVNLVINGPPQEEPYRSQVIQINNGQTNFSSWKANIEGVDLNNQFPAKWEIEAERKAQQPAPRNYPGPRPLSEPESQAMADLTRNENFERVLAFHTQGEVIYWGFENQEPPRARDIVNEFARVSGYIPIQIVDSYAGYKDWFIQDFGKPGYTLELGKGINPLPLSQYDEIYQESLGIFLANLYL